MHKRRRRLVPHTDKGKKLPQVEIRQDSSASEGILTRLPILRHGQDHLSMSDIRVFVHAQMNGTLQWTDRWVLYCFIAGDPPVYCGWRHALKIENLPYADDPMIEEAIRLIWKEGTDPAALDVIKALTIKQADHSITEPEHFLLFACLWKNDKGSEYWLQLHSELDSWLFNGAALGEAFMIYKERRQLPQKNKDLPDLNRHFKPPLINE